MVPRPRVPGTNHSVLVIVLTVAVGFGGALAHRAAAQASKPAPAPQSVTAPAAQKATPAQAQNQAPKIPPDQLDSLVAPIALYPDPLLAQVLAASTYPLEIVQLQQWITKNPGLKDKALADAVGKQAWDRACSPWLHCRTS